MKFLGLIRHCIIDPESDDPDEAHVEYACMAATFDEAQQWMATRLAQLRQTDPHLTPGEGYYLSDSWSWYAGEIVPVDETDGRIIPT